MSIMALSTSAATMAVSRLSVRCSLGAGNSVGAPSGAKTFPAQQSLSLKAESSSLLSAVQLPPLSFASSAAPLPNASLDPSAAHVNIMWADNKVFNTQILVGESESTESVVRRFKKVCLDANIVNECRRRRYFETKQDITKRKQKENARKRKRFQRSNGPRPNFFANRDKGDADKAAASAAADDDDDAEWNAM